MIPPVYYNRIHAAVTVKHSALTRNISRRSKALSHCVFSSLFFSRCRFSSPGFLCRCRSSAPTTSSTHSYVLRPVKPPTHLPFSNRFSKFNRFVDFVSVLPHSSLSPSSGQPLTEADGKSIASWGTVTRTLCFGIRTFLCTFILAAVSESILGTDFLAAHRLLVDPFSRLVLDAVTLKPLSAAVAAMPSKFAAALCHIKPAVRTLLAAFPAIIGDGMLRRVRCMVYAILWKLPAARFLPRPAASIRTSCAWLRLSSALWRRQVSSPPRRRRGPPRCTWCPSRMVRGDRVEITAAST